MITNTTQEVWNYLAKDLSIQRNLQRGVLNVRALAKHVKKERNLKASIDAVISAIRRFSNNKKFKKETSNVEEVFRFSNISTKNNIACLTLRSQADIQRYLSEATKITDLDRREPLRLVKGKSNLKIITDMENIEKIKNLFSNEDIKSKENLSEIRINISLKADQTKGVAARIANEIMLRNININEIIFCVPEIIIYVEQKDLISAYESMLNLCKVD